MDSAKVFTNGGSQAVRLPKSCRVDSSEMYVNKIGNMVILTPKDNSWERLFKSFELFTEDFMKGGIEELPVQERDFQ